MLAPADELAGKTISLAPHRLFQLRDHGTLKMRWWLLPPPDPSDGLSASACYWLLWESSSAFSASQPPPKSGSAIASQPRQTRWRWSGSWEVGELGSYRVGELAS